MKRSATLLFGVLLVLCCSATVSQAVQWPPGTTACACPLDTLLMDNIQNAGLLPKFAATGDTVLGVGGIFTAIDSITTGFSFYLQRSAPPNTPWTGADVFTGGTNTAGNLGYKLGDSIVVYGMTAEFGGGTEILSPNNSFTTPNIIVRRVSSGNPVPDFHVGSVHELNFLPTNPSGEMWEGCLVRVANQMRTVRHVGLGTSAIPGANCLVVDNTVCPEGSLGPCDSLLIETATLAGVSAPPVSSTILVNSVQGVLDQRAISGQNSYILLIRKPDDIVTQDPPHILDAYCVSNDTVRVVFDKKITTASATDVFNYSYASGTIVNAAILEADQQSVDLAITPSAALRPQVPSGQTDELTVNNMVSFNNPAAFMTAAEARGYIHGIQTIYTIQGPNPDSLLGTPCEDVGNFLGNNNGNTTVPGPGNTSPRNPVRLTYTGVCTGHVGNVFYIEDAAGGARSGVSVFAPPVSLVTGHKYLIASSLQEFPALAQGLSETEMTGVTYIRDLGVTPIPAAAVESIHQLNGFFWSSPGVLVNDVLNKCTTPSGLTAEDLEGMLVQVTNTKEAYRTNQWGVRRTAGAAFHVTGPYPTCEDTINIHTTGQGITYQPMDGAIVSVTGIMHLNFGAWEIYPRTNADIVETSTNSVDGAIPRVITFSIAPNPSRSARINFGLPKDARVELAVFDVTGRRVAMIENGTFKAGTYSRAWDGRTEGGGSASAGLYFYRLKVNNETRTVSGVHLR